MEPSATTRLEPPLQSRILTALGNPWSIKRIWAYVILTALFYETIACSLAFAYISNGSSAPPAPSGDFVMWTIGVIGFQLAVVPSILVSLHGSLRIRIALAGFLGSVFWAAHSLGDFMGTGAGNYQADYEVVLLWSFPLGFAIAGLPFLLMTLLFRIRLKGRSDLTKGEPVTIGKMMGLTAAIAAATAYGTHLTQGKSDLVVAMVATAGSTLLGSLIFLIAIFGLRRKRNLFIYAVVRYGILTLIVGAGVTIAGFFAGRGMLWQQTFWVSIAVVSLILHSLLFTLALKLLDFEYVRVESRLAQSEDNHFEVDSESAHTDSTQSKSAQFEPGS